MSRYRVFPKSSSLFRHENIQRNIIVLSFIMYKKMHLYTHSDLPGSIFGQNSLPRN